MQRLWFVVRHRATWLVAGALLAVILSGSLGSLALVDPRVALVMPEDGMTDVRPTEGVQIQFNQWVWPASVANAATFDTTTDVTAQWRGNTIILQPDAGLQYGTEYQLNLAGPVRNLLGRTVNVSRTISFTTVPYREVVRLEPADTDHDIALDAPISVEFNAPVIAAEDVLLETPQRQPMRLTPSVAGTGRWLTPQLFVFDPDEPLRPATTYTATVRANLSHDGAMRLEEPITWSFTTAAPLLVSARPAHGAKDVSTDSVIDVQLDPIVDSADASKRFSLTEIVNQETRTVSGELSVGTHGFRFTPDEPLQRGARYQAQLDAGVRSDRGVVLNDKPVDWRFHAIDTLRVAYVEPNINASDVPTSTQQISVSFNYPIALDELDNQDRIIDITPEIPGVGSWRDPLTYIFSPTVALDPSTRYRARVVANLRDQTGGELAEDYTWQFTTPLPQVLAVQPRPDAQFVAPTAPIEVTFNQAIDPDSLNRRTLQLTRSSTQTPLTGTLTVRDHSAIFTPTVPLERGASYRLAIATDVQAAHRTTTMAQDYRASFRVAPQPALDGARPASGTTNVDYNNQVQLDFSTPMDWESVEDALTIDPQPRSVYLRPSQNTLILSFPMLEDTEYRVAVDATAQDAYGVELGEEVAITFRTRTPPPSLAMIRLEGMGFYNAYAPVRIPLRHSSLQHINYTLYRIDPATALTTSRTSLDEWEKRLSDPETQVLSDTLTLTGKQNQRSYAILELGALEAGTYALVVEGEPIEQPDESGWSRRSIHDVQVLAVSPYALTLKQSSDQLFVWAVDLKTGAPVADLPLHAAVVSYDQRPTDAQMQRVVGHTDAAGILRTTFERTNDYSNLFVWADPADGGFALTKSRWRTGIRPRDFNISDSSEPERLLGNVTTDRPIYRPDQVVHVRGALRFDQEGRYDLPDAGQDVAVTITDPVGTILLADDLAVSAFGTFSTTLALERSVALGDYSIKVALADDPTGESFAGSFMVAEYRKPAFAVEVTSAQKDVVQGGTLQFDITSTYYFGGAVANAPITWRLLANPMKFTSEAALGFRFEHVTDAYNWYRRSGEDDRQPGGNLISNGRGTTDAQGNFQVSLPATLGEDLQSRQLVLDVEVTDVDNQVIAAQGAVQVHPGAFYIGLRSDRYVHRVDQPQQVALMTVGADGQPTAGHTVDVGVYQRTFYSVRERQDDGQFYWTSNYSETLVMTQTVTTDTQGQALVAFTPKSGGTYRINAVGRDQAGHTITTSAYSWVYQRRGTFQGVDNTHRLELVADQDSYQPGDTAQILVNAPYRGMTALLTLERGEVVEHRVLTLTETTELIEVPITANHAPNVYLSLVLVKPTSDELLAPEMRVGMLNIPVSTEQQELAITITPDTPDAAPGDEVTYTIKATDYTGAGVQAELALALVDKAVLALADDPNPTLRQSFYTERPLGIFTANSLIALVDRLTLALEPGRKGGGGGLAADVLVRRNFPDTAYWNPALVTNERGEAQVTVTLPDALTTWRMTARGITQDTRVGQATHELVVSRPLQVRAAIPRFLTVGDQPVLRAVVHNATTQPLSATVTLAPDVLDLSGPSQQSIEVAAASETVVAWPVTVGSDLARRAAARQAKLQFTIYAETVAGAPASYQDAVEHTVPIQRYVTPDVILSAGQVDTAQTIAVNASTVLGTQTPLFDSAFAASGTEQTQGEIELELTPSLFAGMEQGLNYLEQYPHGCTEQTMSRFFPNAVISWLRELLGIKQSSSTTSLEHHLDIGLQRLYVLQHLDGGWGWWEDDESQPYLTAYVVHGLDTVRKAGHSVDATVLNDGIVYLEQHLDTVRLPRVHDNDLTDSPIDARAYTLFVLSEVGRPDRGRTVALYDLHERLDVYGKAYLLMALDNLGDQEERVQTLANDLLRQAQFTETAVHWQNQYDHARMMSSDTRTTALVLQALTRADPHHPLVDSAVQHLMEVRQNGHWRTTKESAVTLIALADYIAESGVTDANYTYSATLDGRPLHSDTVNRDTNEPANIVLPLAKLKAHDRSRITIQRSANTFEAGPAAQAVGADGQLYYTLSARTYQDAATAEPIDQGFQLQRNYIAVDPDTLTPTGHHISEMRLGDVVQVQLTLTVPETADYFAIEDMLPAGLEVLDSSLKTVTTRADGPAAQHARWSLWPFVNHTEVHDNQVALFSTRLAPGTYHYTYMARATTVGTFQVLPAKAYQMYAPERFGQSAGTQLVVREE